MESSDARDGRSFDIRFTPALNLFGPPTAAQTNAFDLRGAGTMIVRGSEVVLNGKRRRSFRFGAKFSVSMPLDGIVNVNRDGKKVVFEYRLADSAVGTVAIWSHDDAAGEAIVRALPVTKTERFEQKQLELSAFNTQLMAVSPTAWVTPVLVAANVLVFLWTVWRGAGFFDSNGLVMIALGSDYGPLTTSGEWWRLITSTFLHFGILHIALNMWALWGTGQLVERLYGSRYFLLLYMLAGICGSIASVAWNPGVNSAGASGAIFGVFGAMLAFVANKKAGVPTAIVQQHRGSTAAFVAYNLLNGFTHAGIDNAAHLGGLIGGFAIGWLLVRPVTVQARQTSDTRRIGAAVAVGIAALAVGIWSLHARSPDFTDEQRFRAAMLDYSVEEGRYVETLNKKPLKGEDDEVASRIEKELLPMLDRMSSAVSSVPALPERSALHEFQSLLVEYIDNRRAGFRKLVQANETHDAATSHEAERLLQESEQAFGKLRTLHVTL
jgi:rhomboid protease GluP